MIHHGALDAAPDPSAAIHFAQLRRDVLYQEDRAIFHSVHLEEYRAAAEQIGAWATQSAVTARIEAAFFAVEDPRLQKLLSDALR